MLGDKRNQIVGSGSVGLDRSSDATGILLSLLGGDGIDVLDRNSIAYDEQKMYEQSNTPVRWSSGLTLEDVGDIYVEPVCGPARRDLQVVRIISSTDPEPIQSTDTSAKSWAFGISTPKMSGKKTTLRALLPSSGLDT